MHAAEVGPLSQEAESFLAGVLCVNSLCSPVSAVSRTWAQKHTAAKQIEHKLATDQVSDN